MRDLVDDAAQFVRHRGVAFLACSIQRTQQAMAGTHAASKHPERVRNLIIELCLPARDEQIQAQRESNRCGKDQEDRGKQAAQQEPGDTGQDA